MAGEGVGGLRVNAVSLKSKKAFSLGLNAFEMSYYDLNLDNSYVNRI